MTTRRDRRRWNSCDTCRGEEEEEGKKEGEEEGEEEGDVAAAEAEEKEEKKTGLITMRYERDKSEGS